MNLLKAIGVARHLSGAFKTAELPDWALDPMAFYHHFGVPHEAYAEIVSALSPEQAQLLDQTIAVNPEAAVLWILHMEQIA